MAKVAIMGFGTVGGGVAEVLRMNASIIQERLGEEVYLKYILDIRDLSDSPYADRMIKDFSIIEKDPEVEVVVEAIGGAKIALEFTRRALLAGKHVVTSNKELVAGHGKELLAIAKERGVSYLFEASVGGGIPILRPLMQCLAGNEIQEICGILNGTTNYILTRMFQGGIAFEEALREAQSKGYAEADPTADVEGLDAGRKICILSDLAWGREVRPEAISMEGISHITPEDVRLAEANGYRVKLLGRALRLPDGRQTAYVAPHLVPVSSPIAGVDDVFNAILVRGNAVGDAMFYGRGAGDLPTASAVVGDILDILQHRSCCRTLDWSQPADLVDAGDLATPWFVRGGQTGGAAERTLAPGAVMTIPMTAAQVAALQADSAIRVLA